MTYADVRSARAIANIEAVFERMADAMLNDRNELSITLKVRNSKAKGQHTSSVDDGRTKRIGFPGKTEDEAWRFGEMPRLCNPLVIPDIASIAVVLRILELMHEALRNDGLAEQFNQRDLQLFQDGT